MKRQLFALVGLLAGLLASSSASAAPLTLAQLDQLNLRLSCVETCGFGREALLTSCTAACPAQGSDWDKNLDGVLTRVDHQLANLEYVDNSDGMIGQQICYESGAVVPLAACGLQSCLSTRTAAQCADVDADGLRAFQETLIGSSDSVAAVYCGAGSQCGLGTGNPVAGFGHECRYEVSVNRTLCMPRSCTAGVNCLAFHVERVASDREEVIVRLFYDYSPVPATVLDLYVEYTASALQLMEARPLSLLTAAGKSLQVRSVGSGLLRVMVLGDGSSAPVPRGGIVELIFARSTAGAATVGFSKLDGAQQWSMAPDPGAHRSALANDTLWGADIAISGATNTGDRLVLYYSFDDAREPLDFEDVRDGQGLCNIVASCVAETDALERSKRVNQYAALQGGRTEVAESIEGVSGAAAYFDGLTNHLELPISLNDPASGAHQISAQNWSVSSWFYFEGDDGRGGLSGNRRVLFSHNQQASQITRYGVAVRPAAADRFDLVWFMGDVRTPSSEVVIATGIQNRVWTHFGISVDAASRVARFYLNGAPLQWGSPLVSSLTIGTLATDVFACPQLPTAPATGIVVGKQGDVTGGRPPETVLFASAEDNLFGIEETDPNGMRPHTLVRTGDSSATDPDYSPDVDRLVYASTTGGSREIWISEPDGSNPVQITRNFGDTARGIFAGNPRWAPRASAIVFESNAFDVAANDNNFRRTYQLYYIAYNATLNVPAIPLAAGGTATVLDYQSLISTQTVNDYRVAYSATHHHYGASWLRGAYTEGTTSYLGDLLVNVADADYEDKKIARITFSAPINASTAVQQTPFAAEPSANVSVLHAVRTQPFGQAEVTQALIERKWVDYAPTVQFSATSTEATTGVITTTIQHTPTGYSAPACWDKNLNSVCDATESTDGTVGCAVTDCYPSEVFDLFIKYDPALMVPRLNANLGVLITPDAWITANNKELEASQVTVLGEGSYVKLEVRSPIGNRAIPAAQAIATVQFTRVSGTARPITTEARNVNQQLYVQTNWGTPAAFAVSLTDLEEVSAARFSPDASRLLLAGLQNARPILATTTGLTGTSGMQVISSEPMSVDGLDWNRIERTYPCNWVGGFRDPVAGRNLGGFRGGLDELRIYSYVRPAEAFRSESDRGRERLVLEGLDGQLAPQTNTCLNDTDCPAYQLCNAGTCGVVTCSYTNPYACTRGQCTLMPTPSDPNNAFDWVCSAECGFDNQCFERECLNGPCRFCDAVSDSCIECRDTVEDYGTFQVAAIEGCPDRNSYACVEGSCLTECYSFENGESQFLCDPALEYCYHGRCELIAWSWSDLAPATMSGLAEMQFDLPGLTETLAIPQLYPVEIEVFGVEDYGQSPELLVQGQVTTSGANVFGGAWFDIGRIFVHNRTRTEAQSNHYTVYSHWPLTGVRMQLVLPPYDNMTTAATGLAGRDNEYCENRMSNTTYWTTNDPTACYRRAPGSNALLGYSLGIPQIESRKACSDRGGGSACGYDAFMQEYLPGGQPAVVVSSVRVNGTTLSSTALTRNVSCSYEGTNVPVEPVTLRKRSIYYGDPAFEQSNRKQALYPSASFPADLIDYRAVSTGSWALLNCNFTHETDTTRRAEAIWTFSLVYPTTTYGAITETANGCTVDANSGPAGVVRQQCYEHSGATMDYLASETQVFRTLEFSGFRSSGWDVIEGP